jgi:hypothetical protein
MHRFLDCSKFEPEVAPSRQPILERGEGAGTVGVLAAVAAVVEAQDIACASRAKPRSSRPGCDGLQAANEPFGCGGAPVSRKQSPHHDLQVEFARSTGKPRIPEAKGRAKPSRSCDRSVGNSVLTPTQFITDLRRTKKEKIGMRLGVIADQVTSRGNLSNQVGTFARVASDQKKRSVCVMSGEKIEELRRDYRVRSVVEGDRELPGRRRVANCWPEELRLRMPSAIGGQCRNTCEDRRDSDRPRIHAVILAWPAHTKNVN